MWYPTSKEKVYNKHDSWTLLENHSDLGGSKFEIMQTKQLEILREQINIKLLML